MDEREYDQKLSEAASLLAGEVPAGEKRDWLIELSRRFKPKPEYADGTIAWVTTEVPSPGRVTTVRHLAQRNDGEWRIRPENPSDILPLHEASVTRVEPLRVLGDDEIAVKRPSYGAASIRAHLLEKPHLCPVANVIAGLVADALDAEAGDAR